MNEFFQLFGGTIAVLSSIIATIVINKKWKKYRHNQTRKYLVPLFYWTPIFLLCCMVLHNINNGLNTINYMMAGTTSFNFYQYSYQLFGFVVAYQSYLLLKQCRKHVAGNRKVNRALYFTMGLIVLTTLPTFIFTSIGIIPSIVLIISYVLSLVVHKPATVEASPMMEENAEFPLITELQPALIVEQKHGSL